MAGELICFCLRRDSIIKPGGDSGKVTKYIQYLKNFGFDAVVVNCVDDLNRIEPLPSIIHIMNVDVPYENFAYYRWAKERKVPLVFSTIHHQFSYMMKYSAGDWVNSIFLYQIYVYLISLIKELIRYRSIRNILSYRYSPVFISKMLIGGADLLLPLSDSEMKHLALDFGMADLIKNKSKIVPNAITFDSPRNYLNRDIDVLVVGRVEPRKNQLKIALALKDTDFVVKFVGRKNLNHSSYFDKFLSVISDSKNLSYEGEMDHRLLSGLYERTKVNLSNSWFEVVSQVDLEACSLGCKVVVSKASAISEYFDCDPISLDPSASADDIVSAVKDALADDYSPRIKNQYRKTWSEVTFLLAEIYSGLLKRN